MTDDDEWLYRIDERLAPCPVCGYSVRLFARRTRLEDGTARIDYYAHCPSHHDLDDGKPLHSVTGTGLRFGLKRDRDATVGEYDRLAARYDGPHERPERDWRDLLGDSCPERCPVCGREPTFHDGHEYGCPDHRWIMPGRTEEWEAVRKWNDACRLPKRLRDRGTCPMCGKRVGFDLVDGKAAVSASCDCVSVQGDDWRVAARRWFDHVEEEHKRRIDLIDYQRTMGETLKELNACFDGVEPSRPGIVDRLRDAGFDEDQITLIFDALR